MAELRSKAASTGGLNGIFGAATSVLWMSWPNLGVRARDVNFSNLVVNTVKHWAHEGTLRRAYSPRQIGW